MGSKLLYGIVTCFVTFLFYAICGFDEVSFITFLLLICLFFLYAAFSPCVVNVYNVVCKGRMKIKANQLFIWEATYLQMGIWRIEMNLRLSFSLPLSLFLSAVLSFFLFCFCNLSVIRHLAFRYVSSVCRHVCLGRSVRRDVIATGQFRWPHTECPSATRFIKGHSH